ncbi:hypothetical protein [Saccharothrix sp. HUAS TT1]|uniref:hypothetical protein n=1 Tax=unclassified Saccharothrix TaxID=2593673 RepID=UPI00345BF41A
MTSVPPPRRRPVPSTPTTRPRVAGLRKRPEHRPEQGSEQGPTPGPDTAAEPAGNPPSATTAARTPATSPPTDTAAEPTAAEPSAAKPAAADQNAASPTAEPVADTAEPAAEGAPSADSSHLGLIEPGGSAAEPIAEPTAEPTAEPSPRPRPRPRPTGRRKRAGEAVAPSVLDDPTDPTDAADTVHTDPADTDTSDTDTDAADWAARHNETPTRSAKSTLVLTTALVVLAGLLLGLGLWFQGRADDVDYNQALVDSAGTTEVAGQAREAVEKAFSYNFADVAATEEAADELLVGKAKCQYDAIFGPVRTLAPEQKLVVTVKAVSSGVTSLDGDRATVLLFLDQVTTRTTDNQSGGGIAMMRASAQRVNGRWKVDNMEMFGQSADQAAGTSKC